ADSARVLAQRWAAEQPRDEAPYREWAIALQDAHRYAEARQVFLAGRRALGRRGVFGVELGELLERVGEWEGAAREWAAARGGAGGPGGGAGGGATPEARRVRALALARYAEMVPEPLAVRARAEAARAFLAAGDRVAARRVLERVAADSTAPPDAQALAQGAL